MRQGMSTELREDAACSTQRASSLPFSVDALMARAGTRARAETPQYGTERATLLYGPPAPQDRVPSSPVKSEASDRDEATWSKSACSPQPRRFTNNIFTTQDFLHNSSIQPLKLCNILGNIIVITKRKLFPFLISALFYLLTCIYLSPGNVDMI